MYKICYTFYMTRRVATGVVHRVPTDLRKALLSSQTILNAWNNLTPLARNEWICWTASVKNKKQGCTILNVYKMICKQVSVDHVAGLVVHTV